MTQGLPTGARGQTLALGLTIVTFAAAWLGVAAPSLDWYQDRSEQLRRKEAVARRMAALVETLPALRQEAAAAARGAPEAGESERELTPRLLTGASDPLAAASLQQMIDELAAREGARIGSQEILPVVLEGELRAIAVRLTVTAPFRSLTGLLLAFARSETPMIASDIVLRGPTGTARDAEPPIDASLTVVSYRAARADTR